MDGEPLFLVWLHDTYSLRSAIPFPLRCTVLRTQPGRIWAGTLPYRHRHHLRVRTEVGRGSKKKRPTQKSTGSPGPRGEERRTHHRLVFLVVWEPAVIFLPPYSTKPGQTATPTQPSTSSQTFFCRTITESAPFCLMQLDISISLQHFYVCILAVFQVFFPKLFLQLARAAQNFHPAFQRACSPPSHFLSYVNLTTALSAPSIISIMKTVSITKARTDPWGISLTPVLKFTANHK